MLHLIYPVSCDGNIRAVAIHIEYLFDCNE